MASSKPQASCSASSEELSKVQVLDSNEPLVTVSSSVPLCSVSVTDSKEPPVPTTTSRVQVLDSDEPLVLASPLIQVIDSREPLVSFVSVSVPLCSVSVTDSKEPPVPTTTSRVQVLDSNEPLVLASCGQDPLSVLHRERAIASSGLEIAGPSGIPGPSAIYSPDPTGSSDSVDSLMEERLVDWDQLSDTANPGTLEDRINDFAEDIFDWEEPCGSTAESNEPPALLEALAASRAPQRTPQRTHLYTEEVLNFWNMERILADLGTEDQCLTFCEGRGLILATKNCRHHRRAMTVLSSRGSVGTFVCRTKTCKNRFISRSNGTWFENVKLPLPVVFKLMYCYVRDFDYFTARLECSSRARGVAVSEATIADWYNYCRETIVVHELDHQPERPKIGGPGKVVQIGKSKFGRRKYNRGRQVW